MDKIYTKNQEPGTYHCYRCGHPLFRSVDKFDSGTRWPSFRKAIKEAILTQPDHSFGLIRTEILCADCRLHLGHVFDDGILCGDTHHEAGRRYCVLSSSLHFRPQVRKSSSARST